FGLEGWLVSLVQVDCSGNEATLWDCKIRSWGLYNSSVHYWDAAVVCQGFSRLVGGDGACAGRLEVRQGRAWVGVCEDQVDMKAAQVVCRELGCGEALAIPGRAGFGRGSGSFLDRGFQCNGSEPLLSACARRPAHRQGCTGPASVTCSSYTGFRLGNSSSGCSGRVEVAVRGTWGSVSADIPHGSYTVCSGGCCERGRRWRCPRQPPQPMPCVATGSRQVRLVGSSGRCAGRVEVYSGGSWSSVCQEGWDLQDAAVVCRQLGCGRALDAPSSARSGAVPGPLWPYIPDCSGSEESLWECGRTERRQCGRGGGAGAVCSEQLLVQLAGGHGRCRGYLEVSYNGTWGRVCASGTSSGTAAAVCRQLGCGDQGSLSPVPSQQPPLAWLAWVGCEDGARSLWGCPSAPW
ncbi:C163A protein, partial [Vidua macroura]|nr:C163A protein [Vidua macroura]